jgi:hypothetical protein
MTTEHQELANRYFAALEAQDEAAIEALTYPQSGFALIYDLWGWAGLELYGGRLKQPQVTKVTELQPGLAAVEVQADGQGATLFTREERLFDLRPQWEEQVSAAFEEAERRGARLPWRGPAPDPVEQKIRNALAARQATLDRQRGHVHYWRLVRDHEATADRSQPEAWAAAVEAVFQQHEGRVPQLNDVANAYGARKATVKARGDILGGLLPAMKRVEHG